MSESKKPVRKIVHDPDYIKDLINANLVKDLYDNEEICPTCHGTGMVINNNVYGLKSEGYSNPSVRFPYLHAAITFCPNCYNGIVHRCKYCGEIMDRISLKHNCEKQLEEDRKLEKEQEDYRLLKAPVLPDKEARLMACLYSDDISTNNGYFFEWEDFFEDWFENHDSNDPKPEYVWSTIGIEPKLDAADIAEIAVENSYDDAIFDISESSIKDLQHILNNWLTYCGVGTTYCVDYRYKIKIPWEDVDE